MPHRSRTIQEQEYLFLCQRDIEMNPAHAWIIQHPGEYRWASYSINRQGEKSPLITRHLLYDKMGRTNPKRQQAYRKLFRFELNPGKIDKIGKATNSKSWSVPYLVFVKLCQVLDQKPVG